MRVAIVGAGAWGTALAQHTARRHPVMLWMRDPEQCRRLSQARVNQRYLPGVELLSQIEFGCDPDALVAWLDKGSPALLVVATSVAGLAPSLEVFGPRLPEGCRGVVWLCKGIEPSQARLPHRIAAAALSGRPGGALSGPSFAQEVAAGLPVALTIAGTDPAIEPLAIEAFHHASARIYTSDDLLGVELGGALKNVMAIAAGISDGLALGANARAALVTRALAEMSRLGVALGARAETFMGLTGLGDLVLTCTGALSRNRRVGLALAEGQSTPDIVARLGHVAEGVLTAPVARALAREAGVEMPLVEAVCGVLEGHLQPVEAVHALLARDPRAEFDH
jgi:glycerol-3-phosphate dehydrogenase (NAD(P)+)